MLPQEPPSYVRNLWAMIHDPLPPVCLRIYSASHFALLAAVPEINHQWPTMMANTGIVCKPHDTAVHTHSLSREWKSFVMVRHTNHPVSRLVNLSPSYPVAQPDPSGATHRLMPDGAKLSGSWRTGVVFRARLD
ncbi:hypothetical protein VFPPC_02698 [Pochonia chlamydosporia 170]|uniref:Uncharacterized protein n=1 Tax=Pochonia chlamydosporia 170 TaxID=1380566 RepID=A0A179FYJ7_METCM|nr:hypothetical protein VFPPC_02698 [Pochonia chlamydosporia 170]OAQ70191.2 hypothetical protein VFPPC_02698 [Pochonia chlamydosporia 170]